MGVQAGTTTPVAVLLGTDVPELGELLSKRSIGNQPTAKGADVLLITTCAQAKKIAEEEEALKQKEAESRVSPNPLLPAEHDGGEPESSEIQSEHMIGGDFPDDLFGVSRETKTHKAAEAGMQAKVCYSSS